MNWNPNKYLINKFEPNRTPRLSPVKQGGSNEEATRRISTVHLIRLSVWTGWPNICCREVSTGGRKRQNPCWIPIRSEIPSTNNFLSCPPVKQASSKPCARWAPLHTNPFAQLAYLLHPFSTLLCSHQSCLLYALFCCMGPLCLLGRWRFWIGPEIEIWLGWHGIEEIGILFGGVISERLRFEEIGLKVGRRKGRDII